jgi:hypothetical protein
MRSKIVTLLVIMLLFSITFSIVVPAESEADPPQIIDEIGDAFGYIDIDSIWFFEQEQTPDYLYVSMKINNPSRFTFQQTFAVFWKHNGVQYSCGLHLGFDFFHWQQYDAGKYEKEDQDLHQINGTYDFSSGVITWTIPKNLIGNPQDGDILIDTWSNAFRRLGILGRLGYDRVLLDSIILKVFGNHMWDFAPEYGTYGEKYSIQY